MFTKSWDIARLLRQDAKLANVNGNVRNETSLIKRTVENGKLPGKYGMGHEHRKPISFYI